MQNFGVCYSVPGGNTSGWQTIGLHNNSEVTVDFNLWITVSDGGNDVQPLPTGTKWTYWNLIAYDPATHSDTYSATPPSVYTAGEIAHMKANADYTILAAGKNIDGSNDNVNIWTVRCGPGQYAWLRMSFNTTPNSLASAGGTGATVAAIGGRCRLWYQAVQVD